MEHLNRWDLAGAQRDLERAIALDTTFGLAYYKLALTRGWVVGTEDSVGQPGHPPRHHVLGQPAAPRARGDQRLPRLRAEARPPRPARCTSSCSRATPATPTPGTAWEMPGSTTPPGSTRRRPWTQAMRAFKRALALDPNYALAYEHVHAMLSEAAVSNPLYALLPGDSFAVTRSSSRAAADRQRHAGGGGAAGPG